MSNKEMYKKILLEKEQELLATQKLSAESEKPVSLEDPIGRLTRIDAIQRQQQALHTKARTEKNLRQVREALERIDSDHYGKCRKCENEIEPERLEYMPETTICTKCMRKMTR